MFKGLKYYEDLSEQLAKEIEICKNSYENFEKSKYLTTEKEERTEEQRRIAAEFIRFCQNEGFLKKGAAFNFENVKIAINKRVEFLEQQKKINDEMVALLHDLEALKQGNLGEETVENLKKEAAKHYDPEESKEKYTAYLKGLKNRAIEKKKDVVNENIVKTKKEISKSKKDNNLATVASSAFGPIGNKIYNAYARGHNKNVDLRKKRLLNLIVKLGACAVYFSLAGLIPAGLLSGVPFVASAILGIYAVYKTVANTFREVPGKLDYKDKLTNLKESWFRYRKSRGKGNLSVDKNLYDKIDFSKYETRESVDREIGDSHDHEGELESAMDSPEITTPEIVPETPEVAPETPKIVPETPEIVPETPEIVPETPEIVPENKSIRQISTMGDVSNFLIELQNQNGLQNLNDWSKLMDCRLYLGDLISKTSDKEKRDKIIELRKMFDEMVKTMPEELRERVAISNAFKNNDIYDGRETASKNEMLASNTRREEEYNKLVDLLNNADLDTNVMEYVNDFFSHYRFPNEDEMLRKQRYIGELLANREERGNMGRKK